eukprot:864476-Lingulodinium_polyedra.AAC.1
MFKVAREFCVKRCCVHGYTYTRARIRITYSVFFGPPFVTASAQETRRSEPPASGGRSPGRGSAPPGL